MQDASSPSAQLKKQAKRMITDGDEALHQSPRKGGSVKTAAAAPKWVYEHAEYMVQQPVTGNGIGFSHAPTCSSMRA